MVGSERLRCRDVGPAPAACPGEHLTTARPGLPAQDVAREPAAAVREFTQRPGGHARTHRQHDLGQSPGQQPVLQLVLQPVRQPVLPANDQERQLPGRTLLTGSRPRGRDNHIPVRTPREPGSQPVPVTREMAMPHGR